MLPDHRLAVLLDDLKHSQIDKCLYHTSNETPSLYTSHSCDRSQFPSEVVVELSKPVLEPSKHPDEVWQLRFSPDGKRLASCGTEKAVNIWDVDNFSLVQELQGHTKGEIGDLAWSPDSKYLVTCGIDRYAKLWNADVSVSFAYLNGNRQL